MSITPHDPADFTPSMGTYNELKPFRFWCQKVLPLVYDDSLSYYEVLCKVVDYLNKTMEDVDTLHGDVDALLTAYEQLQSYVNNYFSTLDVQEEINNKLDTMAEDGTLDALLLPYFNAYKEDINETVTTQNSKIAVLEGRMDTFASLTEGSTTGDAELADIRVGVDGTIYNSAGDSVRSQVGNTNYNFESSFNEPINLYNPNKIISGKYIDTDGSLIDDNRMAVTEPILVPNGKTIQSIGNVNGKWTNLASTRCYAVYSSINTSPSNLVAYNASFVPGNTTYSYTNDTGNDVYIRFAVFVNHSTYTVTDLMIYYLVDGIPLKYTPYTFTLKSVSLPTDKFVKQDNTAYLIKNENMYDETKAVPNKYVATNGNVNDDTRYSYIALEVPSGKTIYCCGTNDTYDVRQLGGSVRQYCVKDAYNGNVIASDDTIATAYKYTNNTSSTVVIYFTLYYNHPTHSVSDLVIKIVDDVSEVEVTDYVPYGYVFDNTILVGNETVDELKDELDELKVDNGIVEEYFKDEVDDTVQKITSLVSEPCITFSIITDTHLRPASESSVRMTKESLSNMKAVNKVCYSDAVVHLGDTVAQQMYTEDGATNTEIFNTIREYTKLFSNINRKAYLINGNHDGKEANIYQEKEWYGSAGRLNKDYVQRDTPHDYFYVDFYDVKTRCIFMATPDNIDDAQTAYFGYSERMLQWLVDTALNVENNYKVIMFAHISPFFTWYMPNGMGNLTDFYGICNAFHNHTSYTGTVQSADFSSKSGTKLVAYICGHAHGDAVLASGQTVSGVDQYGNPVTTTNGMPCPVINIGAGAFTSGAMSNYGAVAPNRTSKTASQDLWDTMIYRPDLNKMYFIRFGAGDDREVTVN